jgi:hypothetical protein
MIVLILAALIALVARVDAAGAAGAASAADDDAIDLAIRYADALTGIGSDPRRAPTLDAYDELDELDEDDEVGEANDDEDVDDDTIAPLRTEARQGTGDVGDVGGPTAALRTNGSDDGSDDGDVTATLRGDAREGSDDLGDDGDATERLAFADDAVPMIDPDRELDEDADALASATVVGDPVAGLDGEGDTETSEGRGALALLDAELDPGDAMAGGDAVVAAAPAGAAEIYEQSLRHQRPSPWGRLDVGVSLRRRWSEPMHAPASRRDEVWLVATWRR